MEVRLLFPFLATTPTETGTGNVYRTIGNCSPKTKIKLTGVNGYFINQRTNILDKFWEFKSNKVEKKTIYNYYNLQDYRYY